MKQSFSENRLSPKKTVTGKSRKWSIGSLLKVKNFTDDQVEMLEDLLQYTEDVVFILNEKRVFKSYLASSVRQLFVQPDDFIGKQIDKIGLPAKTLDIINNALTKAEMLDSSIYINYPLDIQNQGKWFHAYVRRKTDAGGNFNGFIIIVRDITEMIQTQAELDKQKELYKIFTENSRDLIALFDPDMNFVFASPSYHEKLGYETNDLIGKPGTFLIHPDDMNNIFQGGVIEKLMKGEHIIMQVRKKDVHGDWHPFESSMKMVFHEDGSPEYFLSSSIDISEKRYAQEALQESLDQYRLLADNTSDLIALYNPKNELEYISPSILPLLGYMPEQLMGLDPSDYVYPSDLAYITKNFEPDNHDPAYTFQTEYRLRHINGKWVYFSTSRKPIFDENGKLRHVLSVCRDISEKMESLRQLKLSEEKYRILAENSDDLIALLDSDMRYLYVSPSHYNILGYSTEELVGKSPMDHIHPNDLCVVQDLKMSDLKKDEHRTFEFRKQKKNGDWVYLQCTAGIISNDSGEAQYLLTSSRNITQQKLAEIALKESERHYKMLAENILDLVALHNLDGSFEYVSPSAYTVLGYSPEELIGVNAFLTLIHPDDAVPLWEKNKLLALEGQKTFAGEFRIRHKDGHYIFFETTAKIVHDEKGRPYKLLTTSRDITEWKKAQFALKDSEGKYRSLIESSHDMIAMIDLSCNILFVNKVVEEYFRVSADEVTGKSFEQLPLYKYASLFRDKVTNIIASRHGEIFESHIQADKIKLWVRVNMQPIFDANGKISSIMVNASDITTLVENSERLKQKNKELKDIAFLQSHVLRAPVSNIKYIVSLMDDSSMTESNKKLFALLAESTERLDEIIKSIVEKANHAFH